MEECFRCHILETRALLLDAVLPDGIVKICGRCSTEENIPIITKSPFPKVEKQQTVRERLSKISGVYIEENKPFEIKKKDELRDLVNENYIFKENPELKKELIHNFHWVVMRARRMKRLTQEQLAREIHEPEIVIHKIEKGFAPGRIEIIRKLEDYLNIRIREDVEDEKIPEIVKDDFDKKSFDTLTIADLQEMKKKRESEMIKKEPEMLEEEIEMLDIEKYEEDYKN